MIHELHLAWDHFIIIITLFPSLSIFFSLKTFMTMVESISVVYFHYLIFIYFGNELNERFNVMSGGSPSLFNENVCIIHRAS